MSKFQLPIQQGTELFGKVIQAPPIVRLHGVDASTPAGRSVLQRMAAQINQFFMSQRQNQSLGVISYVGTRREYPECMIEYTNVQGTEYLDVYPHPKILQELEQQKQQGAGAGNVVLTGDSNFLGPDYGPYDCVEFLKGLWRGITVMYSLDPADPRIMYGGTVDAIDLHPGGIGIPYARQAIAELGIEVRFVADISTAAGYLFWPLLHWEARLTAAEEVALPNVGRAHGAFIIGEHAQWFEYDQQVAGAFGHADWVTPNYTGMYLGQTEGARGLQAGLTLNLTGSTMLFSSSVPDDYVVARLNGVDSNGNITPYANQPAIIFLDQPATTTSSA